MDQLWAPPGASECPQALGLEDGQWRHRSELGESKAERPQAQMTFSFFLYEKALEFIFKLLPWSLELLTEGSISGGAFNSFVLWLR